MDKVLDKVVYFCALVSLIILLIGIIINQNTTYQVVTYNNEVLNVQGYELYSRDMKVFHNDELILIKSYKELE